MRDDTLFYENVTPVDSSKVTVDLRIEFKGSILVSAIIVDNAMKAKEVISVILYLSHPSPFIALPCQSVTDVIET